MNNETQMKKGKNVLTKIMSISILAFFYCGTANAPDTIIKRTDEKIISKITEVNPENVKYKRFDNQDGPVYTLPKSEIKVLFMPMVLKNPTKNFTSPEVKKEGASKS